jgi:hypothetical protein
VSVFLQPPAANHVAADRRTLMSLRIAWHGFTSLVVPSCMGLRQRCYEVSPRPRADSLSLL